MRIAFIGLGNMGAPMAHNLLKAGHALTVFDVNAQAVGALAEAGAKAANSARDAVLECELVITMLPAAAHVRSVYLGEEGLLAALPDGAVAIDSSTIDPQTAREVAQVAAGRGIAMADAPVSGGTGGAQAGTLTFMVGATPELFNLIQPVLSDMGRNIVHCGEVGTGQVAKVCNNLLLGISMIGVAEAMALGDALGIDTKVLAGIINTSTGRCWSSDTYNPWPGIIETAPSSRGYTGGFGTDLMLKDLGLATEAAKQVRQPVLLGALAQQLYQSMSQRGEGGKDFSGIIGLYRKP
ncbi:MULTISPECIES: 3-hydroxyisobutyrate dehydrogenase [Pseudomonas]|uniref:3-hydroxyisobutyrate dehydrogenase n=1 Tax=Pseudomonas lutea TaxID=243924 RepID=A0A9X8MDN3_9PSED|nr:MULTISPECIES: 3-hydroxyisobutyrate dehydrogenase [Pseudomonas]RRW44689.1 3-hydroxyisobutyrate dehydrogenase [Pseudomonas luteola]SEQ72743.1 3-hydroxyisobutyrate dehydrogenase [Pseudomonas lutea]